MAIIQPTNLLWHIFSMQPHDLVSAFIFRQEALLVLFYLIEHWLMDEEEELKIALEKFAQRVLETIEDDHEELAKKLLLDLDPTAFGRLMSQSSLFSLEHLKRILTQYYESQRNEEISWKS